MEINTSIAITFSEGVKPGAGGSVKLYKSGQVAPVQEFIVTAGNISGSTATFTPSAALDLGSSYYILIDGTAFTDSAEPANAFAEISSITEWTFTTRPPDSTPPVVVNLTPANGAVGVFPNISELKIVFDENVLPVADGGFIDLIKASDSSIVYSFKVDDINDVVVSGAEVVLSLITGLEAGEIYYLDVPAGVFKNEVGLTSAAFGGPTAWSFTTADTSNVNIVVNKFLNQGNDTDLVELLVVGNGTPGDTEDLGGLILKDFSGSMASDGGGKFEFVSTGFWSAIPVGTLIVLQESGFTAAEEDTDPSDFLIKLNLNNTTYFTNLTGANNFDIAGTEMILIKQAGSGMAGTTGGIHALAAGAPGVQFSGFSGAKLLTSTTVTTGNAALANNSTSTLGDYLGTDASVITNFPVASFGSPNNTANAIYIASLRGSNPSQGDGTAFLANVTPSSIYTGTTVFGAGLTNQAAAITITAANPSVTLAKVELTVPAELGVPVAGNISLSGAGAGSATFSVTGQQITVLSASVTAENPLTVTISGLNSPSPVLVTDTGAYIFSIKTAGAGFDAAPIGLFPIARVPIPISSVRDQNVAGVPLDVGRVVVVEGVCTEENLGSATQTSGFLQDATGGINLFSTSISGLLTRGNRYAVLGTVTQFNGLTEIVFNSEASVISLGIGVEPAPVVLTITELLNAAESYEGKLVTVANLTKPVTETDGWSNLAPATITLQNGSSTLDIRVQAGSSIDSEPVYPVTVTGVFAQFDTTTPYTSGYQLMPRDMNDLQSATTGDYASWIAGFNVGGQTGVNDDFDQDGLQNALENYLGSDPSVSNPGLTQISSPSGTLVFEHTLSSSPASDLTGSYEWSADLTTWTASGQSSGGLTVTLTPVVSGTTNKTVVVTGTVTGGTATKLFARLKVQ